LRRVENRRTKNANHPLFAVSRVYGVHALRGAAAVPENPGKKFRIGMVLEAHTQQN
jgi:hypothetical protein